jgi:hypothetical protein
MSNNSPPDLAHYPLGLPAGSVRAVVALTVVGVFAWLTLHNKPVGIYLIEAMLIVLAYYFTARQHLPLPPLSTGTTIAPPKSNPLWLPRHTIRFFILLMLFFTVGIVWIRGDFFQSEAFDNLFLVFIYLAGVIVHHFRERRGIRPLSIWQRGWLHLKALLVIFACITIWIAALTRGLDDLPEGMSYLLLGWILFYFGSR